MKHSLLKYFLFALVVCLSACAVIKAPTGGERDKTGPKIVGSVPRAQTLSFRGKTIFFYFNEFLNSGDLAQAIFISPLPPTPPKMRMIGKNIRIDFQETLAPNTTYVITLGTGIQDANEKNPLAEPVQFAFSTGEILDTCRASGSVKDALTKAPLKKFSVFLYPFDSVRGDNFKNIRPKYAATTDDAGRFSLAYLAAGKYRILGVDDADRSFTYNMTNEKVAMAENDIIVIDSAHCEVGVELWAFKPDTIPPKFTRAEWANSQNVLLYFNENVSPKGQAEFSGISQALTVQAEKEPNTLRLHLKNPITDSLQIRLSAVADTANNALDTVFFLKPKKQASQKTFKIKQKLTEDPNPFNLYFETTAFLDSVVKPETGAVYLTDTAKGADKRTPLRAKFNHYLLSIQIPETIDSAKSYLLVVDTTLISSEGYRLDSVFSKPLTYPAWDGLSAIEGRVDSPKDSLILIVTQMKTKRRFFFYDKKFRLEYIEAGDYQFTIIEDRDGNGRWTPGSVNPRRLNEPFTVFDKPVNIKPNWFLEDYVIKYE